MKNVLNEGKSALVEIKRELLTLEEYKAKLKASLASEEKFEKELRQREKKMTDEISSTIKKRRNSIENRYDSEINKSKGQLKKESSKREKTKDEKMSKRIKEETASFVSDNRILKSEIKSILKKEKMPFFCQWNYYFSIYRPQNPRDIATIAVSIILLVIILPLLIILITPWEENMFLKVLCYVVDILLLGGLYIVLGNTINSWHEAALGEIYAKKKVINSNNRKIKKKTRKIKRDKDESIYNLDKFDKKMDNINESIDDLVKDKKAELETFENSTKHIIEEEITERYSKELEELREKYKDASKDSERLEDVVKKMTLDISKKYESYLGKDLLKVDKIDALIEIIDKKEAKKISEAISVYKSRYTI